MNLLGFAPRFIPDLAGFREFAARYHRTVEVAIFVLLVLFVQRSKLENDLDTFTVNFRWMMGNLAATFGLTYVMAGIVSAYFKAIGSTERGYEELAMSYGFFTVMFFSLHIFGLWGILSMFIPLLPPLSWPRIYLSLRELCYF